MAGILLFGVARNQALEGLDSMTIISCRICDGPHASSREHCPFCGARRVFLASHSFEPLVTRVIFRQVVDDGPVTGVEMVRAYRSDFAFAVGE